MAGLQHGAMVGRRQEGVPPLGMQSIGERKRLGVNVAVRGGLRAMRAQDVGQQPGLVGEPVPGAPGVQLANRTSCQGRALG